MKLQKALLLALVCGLLLAGCSNPWRMELGENAPPEELCNLSPKGYVYYQKFPSLMPDQVQATDRFFTIPDNGLGLEVVVKPSEQTRILDVQLYCIQNTKEPIAPHVFTLEAGSERKSHTFEGLDPNQFYFLRFHSNLDNGEAFPFSIHVYAVESDSQISIAPAIQQDGFRWEQIDETLLQFLQVLPFALLVSVIYGALRFQELRNSSIRWGAYLLEVVFVCYLAGLFCLVLLPQNLIGAFYYGLRTGIWEWSEFQPSLHYSFRSIVLSILSGGFHPGSWVRFMLAGNCLMFVPMGFFLTLAAKKHTFPKILPWILGIPILIEVIQPLVCRSFDVDDVILNALGIFLGWCVGMVCSLVFKKRK